MVDREELAWAAGVFEGEGCFSLSDRSADPRSGGKYVAVEMAMTDEDVVRRVASILGLKVTGPYHRGKAHWKPQWRASTGQFERAQAAVAMLWPWLGERRREQAKRMLLGQTTCKGRRVNYG